MSSIALFNSTFTMENEIREKLALAEHIDSSKIIFSGFITHLIPSSVSQILKVAVFDKRKNRIKRAIAKGLTEEKDTNLIHLSDTKAIGWTDFLFGKTVSDPSRYDIVIPVG